MSNPNGNTWNKNKIRVSVSGGYHSANKITMFVHPFFMNDRDYYFLTDRQKKRLDRHFCGCKSCSCNSYKHSSVKWEVQGVSDKA